MSQPPQNPGPNEQPWNGAPGQPNNPYPQQPQTPGQFPQGPQTPGQFPQGPQSQPSAGQPYGAPGDPYAQPQGAPGDPYAQQGAYGAPEAFPEQPKKGSKAKSILGGVLAVVLLAVGGFAIWSNMVKEAALEAGKCIVITGKIDNADHKEVNCDDATQFSYYVAKVNKGAETCGEGYDEYTISSKRRGSETTNKTVCLIGQLAKDVCYKQLGKDSTMAYGVAECAGSDFKVTKVESVADAQCADGEEPWSWTEPARTYCLAQPA